MKRTHEYRVSIWLATLLPVLACICAASGGDTFQLVSGVDTAAPPPSGGSGDSWAPIVNADGRFVLFASTANNLMLATDNAPIPARFPASLNVFLRDRTNQTTALVSVNLSGVAGGDGDSLPVDVSSDGRYVVFESSASDLVSGDTNNATDVFVRDLLHNTTVLVSVSTNGLPGNAASRSPAMTADGRFVAFVSNAKDLVPDDANGIADIFLRDLQESTTTLVSVGAQQRTPSTGSRNGSESPLITPDGRYVAFFSTATNLVPGVPANGDIYVRDLVAGTTVWASSGARAAAQATVNTTNVVCYNHCLSTNGQFIAYETSPVTGSSLYAGLILRYNVGSGVTEVVHTNAAVVVAAYQDINNLEMTPDGRFLAFVANTNGNSGTTTCICIWDAESGSVTLASGDPANAVTTNSICDWPTIDPSGRFVAFLSSALNLVTNNAPGDYHLYLRDLQTSTTTLLDADTNGTGSVVSAATVPSLGAYGSLVAFECPDGGLVPNDRNRDSDVFLRDWAADGAELISAHHPALPSRTANGPSSLVADSVSADGRYIAFSSEADNLVPNDTNSYRDVFVRDLATGSTVLVSGGMNGVNGDGVSCEPSISPDGRYVAFTSSADNLVPGDTNRFHDVFVCDLVSGGITLVSANTNGIGPGNAASFSPVVGTGGRFVVFRSKAWNLASVPTTSTENLFVRDLQAGATYALTTAGALSFLANTPDAGLIAYGSQFSVYVWDAQLGARVFTNFISSAAFAYGAALTPDGRSLASCLGSNLYVTDLATRNTRLVGSSPLPAGAFTSLDLSADGQWLASLRRTSANGTNQLCLYNLHSGDNLIVDHQYNSPNSATGGVSDSPVISPDGRLVAYRSGAADIVPGDTNGEPDIFLYDRLTGLNTLLSAGQFGSVSPNGRSLRPVFSGDGSTLLFQSWASDLVTGDFNHSSDLFAYTFLSAVLLPGDSPGTGPMVLWPTVSGNSYRVEYKGHLGDPDWQPLSGTITNFGTKAWMQDPSPAANQRFYRVVTF